MMFTAKYMHRRHEQPPYYRTVYGDTINEAIKEAERYVRKGFMFVGTTQKQGAVS